MNTLCRRLLRIRVLQLVQVLDARPDDAAAWHRLALALDELGDRAGAVLALRNALAHDAAHSPAHRALGKLLFDCGWTEHALQCFARAALHDARA